MTAVESIAGKSDDWDNPLDFVWQSVDLPPGIDKYDGVTFTRYVLGETPVIVAPAAVSGEEKE